LAKEKDEDRQQREPCTGNYNTGEQCRTKQ